MEEVTSALSVDFQAELNLSGSCPPLALGPLNEEGKKKKSNAANHVSFMNEQTS